MRKFLGKFPFYWTARARLLKLLIGDSMVIANAVIDGSVNMQRNNGCYFDNITVRGSRQTVWSIGHPDAPHADIEESAFA